MYQRTNLMALILALSTGGATAGGLEIFDLDSEHIEISSMSDDGEVIVGRRFRPPGEPDVISNQIRWTPWSGVMDIGGTSNGYGLPAVSGDGQVVVGTLAGDDPNAFHDFHSAIWAPTMFSWTEWDPLDVFAVPAPPSGWSTETLGISKNGLHLVGTSTDAYLWRPRAFHWTRENDRGYRLLEVVDESDAFVLANAVSDDGLIIAGGHTRPPYGYVFGVRWVDGEVELLLDGEGDQVGEVLACNSDCSWMAGNSVGSSLHNDVLAYRWSQTGGVEYLQPFAGAPSPARYAAADLSEDAGTLVGVYFYEEEEDGWLITRQRAWIWFDDASGGQMHDLGDWASAQGNDFFDDWSRNSASAVSADGGFVAGSGSRLGQMRAWRMRLVQPDSIFANGFESSGLD